MKKALVIFGAAALLSGCFDVDTAVELKQDGSGRIDIEYRIDTELYSLGVFDDSSSSRPVPITRDDFRELEHVVDGISLRRYRIREELDQTIVTVRLTFDDVAALSTWYGGDESAIRLVSQDGSTTWTQIVAPGAELGPTGLALGESLSEYSVSHSIRTPSEIRSHNTGSVDPDGRTVRLSLSLSEILSATEAVIWTVSW